MNTIFLIAALKLMSPAENAVVELAPDCLRTVATNETMAARAAAIASHGPDGKSLRHANGWRRPREIVFEWLATDGEKGPWELAISKNADLSNAHVMVFRNDKPDEATGRYGDKEKSGAAANGGAVFSHAEKVLNLEIATRYYWRVTSNITCGRTFHPRNCSCADRRPPTTSATGTFTTADFAPRCLALEGHVKNFRDLGGRFGLGGRRVRQGMIYRSQGLNANSVDGLIKGPSRLTANDIEYLTRTLGIRTDLDLRTKCETAGMNGISPLGKTVQFINRSSHCYNECFKPEGKRIMAENFRVFCDRSNYPILIHCIGGADRTGALAYMLNGALGVSRQGLETDWETTFYPSIPGSNETRGGTHVWNSAWHFIEGLSQYGDETATWNERIELYLRDCGITADELERFRAIMLEDGPATPSCTDTGLGER